jgi:hypothetical protein
MKFNEPVRPASIGRKQVAFEIGNNPSALTLIENEDNDNNDSQSQIGQDNATLAETMKLARVAAYSAASSAIVAGQNEVWGINRVGTWIHYIPEPYNVGNSYIHWDADPRNESFDIATSLAYVDSENPAIIRVRKKGYYLVNVWFRQEAWSHNNSYYRLVALSADSTDSGYPIIDINETDGYPVLRLSSIISIPGSNSLGEPNSPRENESDGGITVNFYSATPGHPQNQYTLNNTNVQASIQIIWLRPYEVGNTYNFA